MNGPPISPWMDPLFFDIRIICLMFLWRNTYVQVNNFARLCFSSVFSDRENLKWWSGPKKNSKKKVRAPSTLDYDALLKAIKDVWIPCHQCSCFQVRKCNPHSRTMLRRNPFSKRMNQAGWLNPNLWSLCAISSSFRMRLCQILNCCWSITTHLIYRSRRLILLLTTVLPYCHSRHTAVTKCILS